MKHTKTTQVIILLLLLLPIIIGLLLWNKLPDPMPSHWNFSNNIDGYTSKPLFVFGLPLFELAIISFALWMTAKDPKKANIKNKHLDFILLLVVIICTTAQLLTYLFAMGIKFNMTLIVMYFLGILFILLGNMLPKLQQSYTVGIRLPWTLNSRENWRLTHRFSGKVLVIVGFLIIITAILNLPSFVFFLLILISIIAPIIYSATLKK